MVILLEHIGDQALIIASHVLSMADSQTALPPCPPLDRLVSLTQQICDDAVTLYNGNPCKDFEHFIALESEISELVTSAFRFYVNFMLQEDRVIDKAINITIVS